MDQANIRNRHENMTMRALYLIAIVAVVDGHTSLADIFHIEGLFRYYSYHLLLFAFGSGYFFSGQAAENPWRYILGRAKKLLVPLYVWNLVYGLGAWFLRRFGGFEIGEPVTLYHLLISPLTDGHQFGWNMSSWFIFPLFLAQVFYWIIRKAAHLWKDFEPVTFTICLAAGCVAVEWCRAGGVEKTPLFLLRTLIILPGYAGGVLYRRCLEKNDQLPTVPYLMGLVIIRALLCTRYENLGYLISTCAYFGCDSFGVYFGGAVAIAFMLRIARLLAPHMNRSRVVLYISRHTFDVMMHHYMGFFMLNFLMILLHKMGIAAQDFSVNRWRTKINYMYAPGGRSEWDILYLLSGLLFSATVAWLVEKLKMEGRKRLRK